MNRYLSIFALTARNSLIREMNFKLNFLLWMVVELLWFAGQLAFIEVLYGQVNEIAGWTKWQLVALVGVHQIIAQLFQAFFTSISQTSPNSSAPGGWTSCSRCPWMRSSP